MINDLTMRYRPATRSRLIRNAAAAVAVLLLCTTALFSQEPRTRLFIGGGYSFTGTGDAPGYAFANQLDIRLGKRFFLSPGLQITNHFTSAFLLNYELRSVTTGLNLYTNLNFLLLNSGRHRISIGAGPVLRLQSTSSPSELGYGVTDPGNAVPHIILENADPVHTLAAGYNIAPAYYYRLSSKFSLAARLGLQNDTRGDLITSEMIMLGISL